MITSVSGSTLNAESALTFDSNGELLIDHGAQSTPNIGIDGSGPNYIRFYDGDSSKSDTAALDLVYRTGNNSLGFERSSDGLAIWETDKDTLHTTYHYNLYVRDDKLLGIGNGSDLNIYHDSCLLYTSPSPRDIR